MMLYPWDIAQLRTELESNGVLRRFGNHTIEHISVRLPDTEAPGRLISPASSAVFRTPECLFGKPEDPRCLNGIYAGSKELPHHTLYTIRNAVVIGTTTALSEDQVLYSDGPARTAAELDSAYRRNQSNAHGFVLTRFDQDYTAHYISTVEPRRIIGHTVFITSPEIGNYGCFLYWILPQLILYSMHYREPVDQYVVTDRSPWVLDAMELLSLPRRPVFTVSETCGAQFETLSMFNVISPEGFFHPIFREAFLGIARRLRIVDGGQKSANRKLYVSRELSHVRAPGYRVLKNEPRIRQLAVDRGFECVFPETLSFTDQVRLFDSASMVVGPSGSGMLTSIFSPPNIVVVDLESFHVTVRQHARIYSSTEKIYSFCFGKFDAEDEHSESTMRRWYLDEDLFAAALDWAEGAHIQYAAP